MENSSLYSVNTKYTGECTMDDQYHFKVQWWFTEVDQEKNTFKYESKLADVNGVEFENPKGKGTFVLGETSIKLTFQDSDTDFEGEITFADKTFKSSVKQKREKSVGTFTLKLA